MTPTQALARFLARSRWEDLPEPVRREAKRALLNVVGCILAGRSDPTVALIRAATAALGGRGGGTPSLAQGGLTAAPEAIIEFVRREIVSAV